MYTKTEETFILHPVLHKLAGTEWLASLPVPRTWRKSQTVGCIWVLVAPVHILKLSLATKVDSPVQG